jgi:hypothetical protein
MHGRNPYRRSRPSFARIRDKLEIAKDLLFTTGTLCIINFLLLNDADGAPTMVETDISKLKDTYVVCEVSSCWSHCSQL